MKQANKKTRRVIRSGELIEETRMSNRFGSPTHRERRETVKPLPEHPAYIKVSGGVTKKLALDFEYARLDVSVELPCGSSQAELDDAYDRATHLVHSKLKAEARKAGVEL